MREALSRSPSISSTNGGAVGTNEDGRVGDDDAHALEGGYDGGVRNRARLVAALNRTSAALLGGWTATSDGSGYNSSEDESREFELHDEEVLNY